MRRALFVALSSLLVSSSCSSRPAYSAEVQKLIGYTQKTQATYALVARNKISVGSYANYEFSAEFNDGDMHRVETPRDRIVVNCRTGWSAHLNVGTGAISHSDPVSATACGVYDGDARSAEIIGSQNSSFGLLQRLKVDAGAVTRIYEIAPNGAIVSENVTNSDGKPRLALIAIYLSDRLPAGDIFSEASLARSVVSDELKKKASELAK